MIPDKIYVREYPDGIARFWENKKKEDVVATIPHEYINKDALLQWAEERFQHYAQHEDDAVCYGQRNAFQQVIDKLNSL